jgi:hypothetical protein
MILQLEVPAEENLQGLQQFIQENESPTAEFIFLGQKPPGNGGQPANLITFQIHDEPVALAELHLVPVGKGLSADAASDLLDKLLDQGAHPLSRFFDAFVSGGEQSVIAVRKDGVIPPAPGADGIIVTKATVFGLNADGTIDEEDNGVGSPALGSINTRDRTQPGAAIPIAQAKQLFGSLAKTRGHSIEVTNIANGLTARAPIVDFGPSTGQVAKGIALDLTFATHVTALHGTGLFQARYRFV